MNQCLKNIPAKFQSRPTFLEGFFSKRVTDNDDRRKTFFLASCSEYSSLIYRVVTMEYRTSDRGAYISSGSALRELLHAVAVVRPANSLIFHCASWASNFCAWPCRRHAADFSFKVKEQLFEQTFCHLIFPVRGKSAVEKF